MMMRKLKSLKRQKTMKRRGQLTSRCKTRPLRKLEKKLLCPHKTASQWELIKLLSTMRSWSSNPASAMSVSKQLASKLLKIETLNN